MKIKMRIDKNVILLILIVVFILWYFYCEYTESFESFQSIVSSEKNRVFIAVDVNERRKIFSNITTKLIEPNKIPEPMFNLETKLSYRGTGNNIPIPENIEYNKRVTEQLMDFLKSLRLYARHYIQTGDITSANKLYSYLDTWAKARAFLGKFDTMYLQWALGTVALTYDILPQKYTHIENWMLECVTKIRQGTKILFKNNNIGIWGAFSWIRNIICFYNHVIIQIILRGHQTRYNTTYNNYNNYIIHNIYIYIYKYI